jgi:prophage antirepressor-like protein
MGTYDVKNEYTIGGLRFRTLDIDGETWFLAKDVASVLGWACTWNMVRVMPKDTHRQVPVRLKSVHHSTVINRTGLTFVTTRMGAPVSDLLDYWVSREVCRPERRRQEPKQEPKQYQLATDTAAMFRHGLVTLGTGNNRGLMVPAKSAVRAGLVDVTDRGHVIATDRGIAMMIENGEKA